MAKDKTKALLFNLNKKKIEPLDFSKPDISNIYVIIAKVISGDFYSISINSLDNSEMVNRMDVPQFIHELAPNIKGITAWCSGFKNFIIMVEEQTIDELVTEDIPEKLLDFSKYNTVEKKPILTSLIDITKKLQYSTMKGLRSNERKNDERNK